MTPPVTTYVVECGERYEHPVILVATLDPYQAFAVAEAVVARSIDPPTGSRAGDLAHVVVTEFAVVQIKRWERERGRPRGFNPPTGAIHNAWWWELDGKSLNLLPSERGIERWSPWFTHAETSTIGHFKRTLISHVTLLRKLGERHDIMIVAAERAMDLARNPYTAHEFGSLLEAL